ncbi:putative membrane protein [Acinetobacter calcoaceticus]|uniref:Putative membrane protein n=1 Tax=Acinetobacter calcoaceticus TaxID=471 RepID=A0A4R1XWS2_ACICA|nr:putative membrane protein [Acinetobacter calcoaceticus]
MIYYTFRWPHYLALAVLAAVVLWASIDPLEYASYLLHQVGTVLMLILIVLVQRRYGLSLFSFCCYLIFLVVHVIGAHYLYSYVPYNLWAQQLLHLDLDQIMGSDRNMYDRWVHFSYGLLLYPFFERIFALWLPQVSPAKRFILVVQFVMATSLIYEWIEWLIAIGLSPEEAENYNGQQGDVWDAHKDMLLATLGTVIAGGIQWVKQLKPKP